MIYFILAAGGLTFFWGILLYLVVHFLEWRYRGSILILLSCTYMTLFLLIAKLMPFAWS